MLLAGVQNAPGQGALVGNYGVFDDFGGPVHSKEPEIVKLDEYVNSKYSHS